MFGWRKLERGNRRGPEILQESLSVRGRIQKRHHFRQSTPRWPWIHPRHHRRLASAELSPTTSHECHLFWPRAHQWQLLWCPQPRSSEDLVDMIQIQNALLQWQRKLKFLSHIHVSWTPLCSFTASATCSTKCMRLLWHRKGRLGLVPTSFSDVFFSFLPTDEALQTHNTYFFKYVILTEIPDLTSLCI
jgi:hypothetical protein